MTPGWAKSIVTNLGPLTGALPSSANTSLSAQGIGNWDAATMTGAAAIKVITGGSNKGNVRRVKVVVKTAGVDLAWKTVDASAAAPTLTAAGAGGANEGSLLCGGGGATEEFSVLDNVDLYVRTSAAAVVQITMWEQ
jgi:hypothetical protein